MKKVTNARDEGKVTPSLQEKAVKFLDWLHIEVRVLVGTGLQGFAVYILSKDFIARTDKAVNGVSVIVGVLVSAWILNGVLRKRKA